MAKQIKLSSELFTNDSLQKFYTQFLKDFGSNTQLSEVNIKVVASNLEKMEVKITEIKVKAESLPNYKELQAAQQKEYNWYIEVNKIKGRQLTQKEKENLKMRIDKVNERFKNTVGRLEALDKEKFNLQLDKLSDLQGVSPVLYLDYKNKLW